MKKLWEIIIIARIQNQNLKAANNIWSIGNLKLFLKLL